jgi:proteasome accessory factor A
MAPERARVIFGTETEYGVNAFAGDGRPLPANPVVNEFLTRAAARPSLPGSESGVFLANGARFYLDGGHPEYASPETTNPWDAVRYSLAGDALMLQLAEEVPRAQPDIARLVVRKGNVDYAGQTTFGSHENYLHRCPSVRLRPALVPHLVSRIVLTGGGGFDPFETSRARFVLSPRALFLTRQIAVSVLGGRALVDERDQPHCAGFSRQHLTCGDANRSHLSLFLRIGTTALVVALIDAGCDDGGVELRHPLRALARVARDTTLGAPLRLTSGRQVTALEIQRHYLQQVQRNRALLPPWTDEVSRLWQDALARLAYGPEAAADRLDWAIKYAIWRRGVEWRRHRSSKDSASAPTLTTPMRRTGAWRAQLCEVDLRFGQLHPPALFEALDDAGVLRHRLPGIDHVEQAITIPPADGRARIRGAVVARLNGQVVSARCGWDQIQDVASGRRLDLASPFAEEEVWRDLPEPSPGPASPIARLALLARSQSSPEVTQSIRTLASELGAPGAHDASGCRLTGDDAILLNNYAVSLRGAGRLDDAEWLMRAALAIDILVRPEGHPKLRHRRNNLGGVLLMQNRTCEARQEVTRAWRDTGQRFDVTSARIVFLRCAIALVDNEAETLFLGQLKSHLAINPLPDYADVVRRWDVARLLDVLATRLDPEALALLRAMANVANGDRPVCSLEEVPRWRETSPVALDIPWPSPCGE